MLLLGLLARLWYYSGQLLLRQSAHFHYRSDCLCTMASQSQTSPQQRLETARQALLHKFPTRCSSLAERPRQTWPECARWIRKEVAPPEFDGVVATYHSVHRSDRGRRIVRDSPTLRLRKKQEKRVRDARFQEIRRKWEAELDELDALSALPGALEQEDEQQEAEQEEEQDEEDEGNDELPAKEDVTNFARNEQHNNQDEETGSEDEFQGTVEYHMCQVFHAALRFHY